MTLPQDTAQEWLAEHGINHGPDGWHFHTLAALIIAAEARGREQAINLIPCNWCDSLLTGPDAFRFSSSATANVENLLNAIRERIRALKVSPT